MIPAVHNDMISDAFHPPFHAVHTFCCLIASADLIVIEKIFCTDLYRGKIRHDNVSASKDPELAPERMGSCRAPSLREAGHSDPEDGEVPS